ncbi:Protein of unknown function DUF3632 [Penicillium italicum]|uniref:Uncharacterized protein n=1 Tax=Penicillium italicum TaxID=40296 RepID=A0A0A2KUI4_PENIT|nr:Protein of unknown function DUF3632 [Penicillium italicum]
MGLLTMPVKGNYGIDIARITEGTVWNDLPFLVTDMTNHWINNCGPLSGTQRLNFASYLAKLASTRALGKRSPPGFTLWRWIYWLKRLHEIREAVKDTSEKHLEDLATESIEIMVSRAQKRNSDIVMVFKTSGYLIYEDKHLLPLKMLAEGEDPMCPFSVAGEEGEKGEESKKAEEIYRDN